MNFRRIIVQIALAILAFIGVRSLWNGFKEGTGLFKANRTETNHTLVLEEMKAMGNLELAKYTFKDVVEHEVVKQWLPNAKAVLIVQGEAIGCVDLTKLEVGDVESRTDTLVVHLPEPELCVFKVDHDKSKVFSTEYALMDGANLVQDAYKAADAKIRSSALEMGILQQARDNADQMLKPILEKVSGQPVLIKFKTETKLNKLR